MKTKHIFVSVLDVGELLPFVVAKTKSLKESFEAQEKAKQNLVEFIDKLEKEFKESIFYMGMDVIGEKSYERFLFKKGGFLEVMVEDPIAMNAHFVDKKRAKIFAAALKRAMKKTLPKSPITSTFIDAIKVQDEKEGSFTVQEWHKIKNIRNC